MTIAARTWFSAAVIWKEVDGIIYFLVQDMWPSHLVRRVPEQVKFPGGKMVPGEANPTVTLKREVPDETGLRLKKGAKSEVVYEYERPGEKPGEDHTQVFYLIPYGSFEGELRKQDVRDGLEVLGPPRWVPALELGRELWDSHQGALLAGLRRVGLMS